MDSLKQLKKDLKEISTVKIGEEVKTIFKTKIQKTDIEDRYNLFYDNAFYKEDIKKILSENDYKVMHTGQSIANNIKLRSYIIFQKNI